MLRGISPLVWRRLLVRSDSTIAEVQVRALVGERSLPLGFFEQVEQATGDDHLPRAPPGGEGEWAVGGKDDRRIHRLRAAVGGQLYLARDPPLRPAAFVPHHASRAA